MKFKHYTLKLSFHKFRICMQNVRVMPRSANETSFLQSYGWHAISTHFSLHEPISLNLQNVLQCALTNQHILAFN